MSWPQTNPNRAWSGNTKTWMSELDDDVKIQDLSIPGTHDSAALKGYCYVAGFPSKMSETQSRSIREQLSDGVRFLDLRVGFSGPRFGLQMMHGRANIFDPDNFHIPYSFSAVLKTCYEFLDANPQETIILSLKPEAGTEDEGWTIEDWFRKTAFDVGQGFTVKPWYEWWDVRSDVFATLKDVRGKILLWRRFPHEGLQPSEAARQLRVSRQMLHSILAERSAVSPEMAVRLGKFCGNGAGFWLRLQTAHDLWHAERKLRDEIRKIPEHAAA